MGVCTLFASEEPTAPAEGTWSLDSSLWYDSPSSAAASRANCLRKQGEEFDGFSGETGGKV